MKRQGFTLIELMIVISIIGILAAVAVPIIQDLMSPSRRMERLKQEQESGGQSGPAFCPNCGYRLRPS